MTCWIVIVAVVTVFSQIQLSVQAAPPPDVSEEEEEAPLPYIVEEPPSPN